MNLQTVNAHKENLIFYLLLQFYKEINLQQLKSITSYTEELNWELLQISTQRQSEFLARFYRPIKFLVYHVRQTAGDTSITFLETFSSLTVNTLKA